MGELDSALAGFKAVREISRQHGMLKQEKRALRGMADIVVFNPNMDEGLRVVNEILAWARDHDDKVLESMALTNIGFWWAGQGDPARGRQLTSESEQLAIQTRKPTPIFLARLIRAVVERWLGRPDKTIELTEGVVELLRMRFGLSALPAALQIRSIALAELGRIEEAMGVLQTGIDLCEKYGAFYRLGALYNCLGYCYSELYLHHRAWEYNVRGEELARRLLRKSIMWGLHHAEITAQATVNTMEDLFGQGEIDKAWNRLKSFEQESRDKIYGAARYQWESRMNYLAARILLRRNEVDGAESVIRETLETVRRTQSKKREGSLLRLLGKASLKRMKFEDAFGQMAQSIALLKEVGNPRQLWESHASLGHAFDQAGRSGDAREQWGAAAEIIHNTANGLTDRDLREGFLNAKSIREILSKAL